MSAVARLDSVCQIIMGQAPDGSTYNSEGRGWPLIAGASDFGVVSPAAKKYTTTKTKLSESGDVILGIRATIGEKVLSDGIYCLGRGVASLRPEAALHDRYLWHWLTHSRSEIEAKARGATFKQVNRDDIGSLLISLPPLTEQRRIAEVLDRAEALRTQRRATIAQLDALAQAIFYEMFGDPVQNFSGFPIKPMIDLVDPDRPITYGILMPGSDQDQGIPYVRVVDMKEGGIALNGLRRTTKAISREYRRSSLKSEDILMSIRGHVGRLASVPSELNGCNITQDTARIAIREAVPVFVRECLRTTGIQRWMIRHTKGGAVRGINLGDVKQIPIIVPPIERQREYARRVTTVERLQVAHRSSLGTLHALFASLQHRAFRGDL